MQEGNNARQQVVERIRQSTSILVAVGNSPSVDALAASLGFTLMLNKLNKHTTAVFSGVIPQAIQFLEPNKSFENNVDALRDFIISLDKEKADRLRYKVEDDVVRIFITPYKTSISQADLQFSQGDFNVDLIIALGVEKREDLDKAIVAHGRILHDATVITVNANNQRSTLGSIDWNDAAASSLCEMLVGMSEAFQQPGILDAQISTALLTGIVANTDRFSNPRTSPRVMTMAAQLMAAGANQQLIATNLEKAKEIGTPAQAPAGPMAKQQPSTEPAPMAEESTQPKKEPGELDIVHEKDQAKPGQAPAAPAPKAPTPAEPSLTEQQEKDLEAALPAAQVQHGLLPEVKEDLEAATAEEAIKETKAPGDKSVNDGPVLQDSKKEEDGEGDYISSHGSWKGKRLEPPTLGGTLNATAEEAHDDAQKSQDAERNKKLLTHPEDAPGQTRSRRNRKRGKGGNANADAPAAQAASVTATPAATPALPAEPVVAPLPPAPTPVLEQPPVVDVPALPPQPPIAPAPEPMPAPSPAPAPEPVTPLPPELPPAPVFEPVAAPLPEPAISPMPTFTPEPPVAPAPQPAPMPEPTPPAPEPVPAPSVDLAAADSAAAAAAAAAQPAQNVVGDLDSAREAVSAALDAQPFSPAGQPMASVGAQPMAAMPDIPVSEPLSPAALQQLPPAPEPVAPSVGDLPPMPPMPPLPQSGTELPPAPNLPGLNTPLPPINEPAPAPEAPQPPATPPPADPKQFKIPGA